MNPITAVEGRIERRLLVNLRVDPDAIAAVLPAPLRPLTIDGWAMAGMCLIRFTDLRPARVPRALGLTTENLAHRFAVEWDHDGALRAGVWIPERHTSSRLTAALGGRAFPAVHALADFHVHDTGDSISIDVLRNHAVVASVRCTTATRPPDGSVFTSTATATQFFRDGSAGIAPARRGASHVVDLATGDWDLQPLRLVDARSSVLDALLPPGSSCEWDSAFVVRDGACTWTSGDAPTRQAVCLPA